MIAPGREGANGDHSMSLPRRLAFLVLAFALLLAPHAARAQADSPVARFATENFREIEQAVGVVAASGLPVALPVLQALQTSRLVYRMADKAVFYRDEAGAWFDAATGEKLAAAPTGTRPVRLNNAVRRAVEAALGALTLLSPDPAKRREAADAVFKSRDPAALEPLAKAITAEKDGAIRQLMLAARAAILIGKPDASEAERIDAIALLRERGDQAALSLLRQVPADAPAAIRKLAADAAAAIESRLAVWAVAQNAWYGLSLGSVLLLAAIGLAITFGVMGVINMAHGEMVMIGAYVTFMVQEMLRTHYPALFDYSLAIALPLAFLTAGLIGVAIERCVIRFLYGRPLDSLLATFGVSLILQQAVRTAFGPTNREVGAPSFMSGAIEVGAMQVTYSRLWIIVFALIVFAALQLALRYTPFGLQVRAVTQNRRMASAMGIATHRIDALTFGLGSGIAGLAGVALSQIDNVSPNLGQGYIIDSFLVVVFGGVGNLWGTLVGAMSIGIANKFLEPYAGAVLAKIALLVLVILFIQKRPRGLFALKGRAIEA